MFPPSQSTSLDIEALSGICGSISIACWIVVFSPQIIENFRRRSADGLSVVFLVIWLAGDVFNILGAVLQGVLPTMIILAVYYTLADIVLLCQVFYYRGFTLKDEVKKPEEARPLLQENSQTEESYENNTTYDGDDRNRSRSLSTHLRRHISAISGTHLSPATPLHDVPKANTIPAALSNLTAPSTTRAIILNTFSILLVCLAGIFGWWLSTRRQQHHFTEDSPPPDLEYDVLGQVFGYFCAALYLGSRLPQILLNHRRKSTEGVSLLFFLFACIGNLTYVLSIFAFAPVCQDQGPDGRCGDGEAGRVYARYIGVNASWIVGSAGTLALDMTIFVQFFLYKKQEGGGGEEEGRGRVVGT